MTCLWCSRGMPTVTFNKKAHTFPSSLGGRSICHNVCDECNHYFGSRRNTASSVEVVFKEVLNVSKYLLLAQTNALKKQRRFKSEYFKIDWHANRISSKLRFNVSPKFQETAGRQFRRGVYKVFLEERQRIRNDGHLERYDFIRKFARYDLNDYPIYIMKPKFQWIPFSVNDVKEPQLRFTSSSDELDSNFRLFEYMIMGHNFVIPTSDQFFLTFESYKKKLIETNHVFGTDLISIKSLSDIDFSFHYMKGTN